MTTMNNSSMGKSKLRIGLLIDDYILSAWEKKMIENIMISECASVSLIVVNSNEIKASNNSVFSKIKNNYGRITYLVIRKILELIYENLIERNTYLPNANDQIECEELLKSVPVIKAKTIKKKWSDYFSVEDINDISKYNIDIFIRCGFGILRGNILRAARYGVWSFHHGDNLKNRGGPPGFWESMESWPETGTILQILTEDLDNGNVLYRSYSCTDAMSITDNRSSIYWKSLSFMMRKIRELHVLGEKEFFDKVRYENRHPVFYSNKLYMQPTNYELFKLTINKILEKCKLIYNNKYYLEQWILMFSINKDFSSSLWRYKKILPPKDRFWADPHVISKDNKYYIYIEEFIYKTNKGHIALLIMDENGKYNEPVTILDRPYHLSYPFIFESDGDYYMIPESYENKTIELYKCVEFPYVWEFKMNLMDRVTAVDATVFYHYDRWWMFVNMVENEGASTFDELYLFYSDKLMSNDWQPHPLNPVVSDCKRARPAGKIFRENGILYRPSQNCSRRYGYGFNINEITVIDQYNYKESLVSEIKPNWDANIIGTHTYNRVQSLHIIDAIYKRRK